MLILKVRRRNASKQNEQEEDDNCHTPCPSCPSSILNEACGDTVTGDAPYTYDFDLKPFTQIGAPMIDWTTLTIDNTEVFTAHATAEGQAFTCVSDVNGTLDYGTHVFNATTTPSDLCGSGSQNSPTTYEWDGCTNVNGSADSSNGAVYTATWSDNGDGVLNLFMTSSTPSLPFTTSWQITYTVQDVNGCSYTQSAYFYTIIPI